jgi:hypothetical protein
MSHLALGFAVVSCVCLAAPTPVRACGAGLVSAPGTVGADAQRIFISVHDGKTDVITTVGVPDTAADYGVLIPVPAQPTLDPKPADAGELARLYLQTNPEVIFRDTDSGGFHCGCGSTGKGGVGSGSVQVGETVGIGPVTAVVLDATSADALTAWLADNSFALPTDGQAIVAAYSGAGRYFIAVRRNDHTATNVSSSVGVHFTMPGDQRGLPLGFARLGAAATVAFTVLVVADETVAPAPPFEALTLDDLDAALLRGRAYAMAVENAVTARGGRAFVIEGSWSTAELYVDSISTLKPLLPEGRRVTRLSTILPTASLTGDVGLDAPYAGPAPNERVVLAPRRRGPMLAGGGLGLLMVGIAFSRDRRRRPPVEG